MLRLVPSRGDAVRRQAARWFVRREREVVDTADDAEFDAWLSADLDHEHTFAKAEELMALFDADGASDADRAALAALRAEIAAPLEVPSRRWGGKALAIAASVVAVLSLAVYGAGEFGSRAPVVASRERPSEGTAFATAVGEQENVLLADGTRVTLNTASSITVDYRDDRRIVRLVRGQALFDVAHDKDRPFSVVTEKGTVTALGTVFEVQAERGELIVTLVKGSVVVDEAASTDKAAAKRTKLVPGQQLVVAGTSPQSVQAVDIEQHMLWRKSMVQFDDTPLAQAVTELNRYTRVPIRLNGERIGALRVSGIFEADDPSGFAAMIGAMLPVEAHENARGEIELRERDQVP